MSVSGGGNCCTYLLRVVLTRRFGFAQDWPEVPDGVKFIKNVEDVKEYEELDVVVVASEDALKQLPSLPRALTVLEGSLMSRSR